MSKDYYQILQVHEQAEQEVIEAAYKRLARKYHPDKNTSPGATAKMQELNEAYHVLGDSNKRDDYDRGRGKSESSHGKTSNQSKEQAGKQYRHSQEQAERERVNQRRQEEDARREREKKREETRKQERELKELEEKLRIEEFQKKRRLYLFAALSVGSVAVLLMVIIAALFFTFRSTETAGAINSVANRVNSPNASVNGPPPASTSKTLSIPSTKMWYDTGIDVPNGRTVRIEYRSGQWTNVVGTNRVDGQGKQFDRRDLLIVPSSYLCALVGKVGNNRFHVGNSYVGKLGKGRLYLSMNDTNDQPGTYEDNGGALTVMVEVR